MLNTEQKTQNIVNEQSNEQRGIVKWFPRDYISYSALSSFENCSYEFYLKYYLGVEWPQTEKMELGTQFQHALNAKYGGRDVGEYLSRMPEKHRETARLLMSKARDFTDIISIDTEHNVDLGFPLEIKFVPDLLTNKAVIENKYTTGYYNADMVKKQKQATFYYIGAKKLFGFEPEVYYQIFNHKAKTVELVKVEKKQRDVDELLFWIDDKLEHIKKCYETGNWQTNHHSPFKCSLGIACPIYEKNKTK